MVPFPAIRLLLAACLVCLPLFARAAPRQDPPPHGEPFSGKIQAAFYAIDPALYAKAPPALLADPGKLLAFFQRSSKEGKTMEVFVKEIAITKDNVELEHEVEWKVVDGDSHRLGFVVSMPAVRVDGELIRIQHAFQWTPKDGLGANHGRFGRAERQDLSCRSQAVVPKGGTTLAGEWFSEIPPPDIKPGGCWHYLLFYSVP